MTMLLRTDPSTAAPTRITLVSPFDDDLLDLFVILGRGNWDVHWWTNRAETMEMLSRVAVPAVICDLPDGSWQRLLEQMQALPAPPRLIVASRCADERLWAEALNLGAYDVLSKPFDAVEVKRVVSAARQSWWSDRAAERAPCGAGPMYRAVCV